MEVSFESGVQSSCVYQLKELVLDNISNIDFSLRSLFLKFDFEMFKIICLITMNLN